MWETFLPAAFGPLLPLRDDQQSVHPGQNVHRKSCRNTALLSHGMRNEMHSQTKWPSTVFLAVVFSVRECPFLLIANKQAL